MFWASWYLDSFVRWAIIGEIHHNGAVSHSTKFWNFWHITHLSVVSRCKVILSQKQSGLFGPPSIDSSVGSQSVTCLLELRLRCTVALYLVCPVYLTYLLMVKLLFKVKVWFLGKWTLTKNKNTCLQYRPWKYIIWHICHSKQTLYVLCICLLYLF